MGQRIDQVDGDYRLVGIREDGSEYPWGWQATLVGAIAAMQIQAESQREISRAALAEAEAFEAAAQQGRDALSADAFRSQVRDELYCHIAWIEARTLWRPRDIERVRRKIAAEFDADRLLAWLCLLVGTTVDKLGSVLHEILHEPESDS